MAAAAKGAYFSCVDRLLTATCRRSRCHLVLIHVFAFFLEKMSEESLCVLFRDLSVFLFLF